jgi:hypothetical protein
LLKILVDTYNFTFYKMVKFTTPISKFGQQGEKSGWTYISVPQDMAEQLKPGNKKSFRVKGKLDAYAIKAVALIPMGDGSFIMPLNATMRKGVKKKQGSMLEVQLQIDKDPLIVPADLQECLADEPAVLAYFENDLLPSHKNYFIKWVDGVKGDVARAKRIAMVMEALSKKWGFAEMFQAMKARR